jgi:hypothetical protein
VCACVLVRARVCVCVYVCLVGYMDDHMPVDVREHVSGCGMSCCVLSTLSSTCLFLSPTPMMAAPSLNMQPVLLIRHTSPTYTTKLMASFD